MNPKTERSNGLATMEMLRDDPLFPEGTSFDAEKDAFNHGAYAKALLDLIEKNAPPLTIGLFGPWGIGKSTIVNILRELALQSKKRKLVPIYFNAWKYSGDSFRRQFLIEVAKQIYPEAERAEAVRRLQQLNHSDVLRRKSAMSLLNRLREVSKLKLTWRDNATVRLSLAVMVALAGLSLYYLAGLTFPAIIAAMALPFLLGKRLEDYVVIEERPISDPKLIFPEQFEEEFAELVKIRGPLKDSTALIVIDDIDRCESDTIRDVLITIKSFLGHQNCYFLVPCDDRSVVRVFQDENQKASYQDELLRKYFTVAVRLAPIRGTDLVAFANGVSQQTGIPASVVQVAVLGNCRDARKMKHFLNTFLIKYRVAKDRQEQGYMPIDVDEHLDSFAKAVLIEDLCPEAFSQMIQRPDLYNALNQAALGKTPDDIARFGISDVEATFPGLCSILKATRDIEMTHVDVFFSLKASKTQTNLERGFELSNAIIEGKQDVVSEILDLVDSDEQKRSLSILLQDQLQNTTDTFRRHTVETILDVYSRENLLLASDRQAVARSATRILAGDASVKVLGVDPTLALRCGAGAGAPLLGELCEKYNSELASIETPTRELAATVTALYRLGT